MMQRIVRAGWIAAITALFLLGFLMGITQTAHAAAAYTEKEPNDTIGQANPVSCKTGVTVSGKLSDDENPDFFRITLSKGSIIDLEVTGPGTDKFRYAVLNGNAEEVVEYRDVCYDENYAYLRLRKNLFLNEGTYYIKVYGFEFVTDENQKYKLKFRKVTAWKNFKGHAGNIDDAKVIKSGKLYRGMLNGEAFGGLSLDENWFKIKSSGGAYYVTFRRDKRSFADWEPGLYDSDADGNSRRILPGTAGTDPGVVQVTRSAPVVHCLIRLPKGVTAFRVWDPSYSGAYSLSITRMPGKVKKLSVRKKGKRKVLVKWKKQSGASGYLLYRATSKHGYYKLIKRIKGGKKTKFTDKKVKKGKRYYYKVVSYKKVNGKTCKGRSSGVKFVKVK